MQVDLAQNYFELFGLPVAFDIDVADLSTRYREIQRRLHPDKFSSASDQDRRLSVQMTALVNEAFQTLKDPLKRGRYVLRLRGIDTGEETDTAMPPEFLVEQMELREALDDARYAQSPLSRLLEIGKELQRATDDRVRQLSSALADPSAASQERARCLVRELQFFHRLHDEIEALEDELA